MPGSGVHVRSVTTRGHSSLGPNPLRMSWWSYVLLAAGIVVFLNLLLVLLLALRVRGEE